MMHQRGLAYFFFLFSGTVCGAEAVPVAVSSCLGCAEHPVPRSQPEPLNLSHHSLEGSCGADAICSFSTTLLAPVDGKIAGKCDFIAWLLGEIRLSAYLSPFILCICVCFPASVSPPEMLWCFEIKQ